MLFKKVVLGISGGVDSAVSAILLKNKGFEVQGVFMQNWDIRDETGVCRADEDFKDAVSICNTIGIPLQRVNFVKEYWNHVFSDLLKQYQSGCTPNPDILCNRFIKFDHFYRLARDQFKADAVATGHYARTTFGDYLEHFENNKNVKLLSARDVKKDQTFFLSQVKQEALQHTMFPLGNIIKGEVKKIAIDNGLAQIANKKESMGICFIGKRNFKDFISEYVEDKQGDFVNVEDGKIVGQHHGLHHWTLGQRAKIDGLPIAMFTAKKDIVTNNIYVSEGTNHPMLYNTTMYTTKPHWIDTQPNALKNGEIFECDFKFQHILDYTPCKVQETSKGLIILLSEALRAITPGQFAVLYKNDECLGSAIIKNVGPSNYVLNLIEGEEMSNIKDHRLKLKA